MIKLRDVSSPRPTAGRVPPHDLTAESSLLTCLLHYPDLLVEVSTILGTEDFYSEAHGQIFAACVDLSNAHKPVDIVTVIGWLRRHEKLELIGGPPYMNQLLDEPGTRYGAPEYARSIALKARRRAVIAEMQTLAAEGYGDVGDELEWIESIESRVATVSASQKLSKVVTLGDAIIRAFKAMHDQLDGKASPPGGMFGIQCLDDILGNLAPGRVTTVGGWPGHGKSALGLQAVVATASEQRADQSASLIISAEMLEDEIALRAAFSEAGVDQSKAKRRQINPDEWRRLTESAEELRKLGVYIDDRSDISIAQIGPTIRRHAAIAKRYGKTLRLVAVDYLQLIDGRAGLAKGSSRELEVSNVAKLLKQIAKSCGVHIVALAQLNADATKRSKDDPRPTSADLRESKSIWANADNVVLIYNPNVAERSKGRPGISGTLPPEPCELIVDKQRGGPTGTCDVSFYPALTRFVDEGPRNEPETTEPRSYS